MARIFKDDLLNDTANVAVGIVAGFTLFWLTSHEKSPLHVKLPEKKIKNLALLPSIEIIRKDKNIHFHHWFNITSLYAFLYWKKRNLLGNKLLNGFLIGGIIQGLSYEDRFSFVYKTSEKKAEC